MLSPFTPRHNGKIERSHCKDGEFFILLIPSIPLMTSKHVFLFIKIGRYIPEFDENRDLRHNSITIKHLLTMSSGIMWKGGVHYHYPMMDAMKRSGAWLDYIADVTAKERPGSVHNYKEWNVILVAAILSVMSGFCYDFINNRVFEPHGIKNDRWIKSPDGVYYSPSLEPEKESVSALTATEMLKIGILFLQNGMWNDKRILPEEYIKSAISSSLQDKGYGFL